MVHLRVTEVTEGKSKNRREEIRQETIQDGFVMMKETRLKENIIRYNMMADTCANTHTRH